MRQNLSLRHVLSWLVLAAGVLPMLGAAIVLALWLLPTLQGQVADSNRALATALATQTEKTLLPPHVALQALAARVDAYEKQGVLQAAFDTQVAANDLFETVYLVGADNRLQALAVADDIAVQRGDFLDIDLSGYAVLRQARQTRLAVWSDVYRSPISDHNVVAAIVPAGKRLLVAELSLSRLSDFVARLAGEKSTMFILDFRGVVVAHPDASLAAQQVNLSNLPILAQRDGVATMNFRLDKTEVIATRVPIRELEWQVLVTQPLAAVQRPVFVTMYVIFVLCGIGTALALWLGILMARRIAARFERLAELSGQLAAGRYPEQWPEQDLAETGLLNTGLQRMAAAVREREAAWRELNRTLEDKVAERTLSLQRAQESLDRSERLAALGSLVAGVAHELNTPIGNGLMAATALQDRTQAFSEHVRLGLRRTALEEFLQDCRSASELLTRNLFRASDLVNSFKQVAVDQTTSQRREFALASLLHEIRLTLQPMLRQQGCTLSGEIGPDVRLDSYPGPLGQVLANLIGNAMVHGYDGAAGEIAIAVHRLPDARVEIVISDRGRGISAQNLKRIFDPFFTTRLGQGGSGLGLHICYNIVTNLLGGGIEVDSEEGRGATFRIAIPLRAPLPAAGAAAE